MKKRRILIIEYKTGSTGKLSDMLSSLMYTVEKHSFRLEDITKAIEKFSPHVVIADMSLQADKNIIAKASTAQEKFRVPVIYFTEAINSRTLYQTMKTDHYGYIHTPYDENTLQTTIELALHKHKNDMSVKDNEFKYRELFNSMTSGVAVYTLEDYSTLHRLTDLNRIGEHILGVTREEVIGKPMIDILTGAKEYKLLDIINRVQETSIPEELTRAYYEDEKISGWFNRYIYKLPSGEIVHIFHDVTEQIKAEEELKTKQKELESLNLELAKTVVEETDKRKKNEQVIFEQSRFIAMGQLISGIAHQWRQPLSALGINIEDLEDAYISGELDSDYIKELTVDSMDLIKTISKTMDDLSNFFKSSNEDRVFSLNKVVAEVYSLLKARLFNSNINFILRYKLGNQTKEFFGNDLVSDISLMDEIMIEGAPAEFKQVLINTINNSIDAILKRMGQEHLTKGIINFEITSDGENVKISIEDNGTGIAPEISDKIFEPYITTKEEGTGVGLYLSKIIVEENMNGKIDVSSSENGFIVNILIPIKEIMQTNE